MKEGNMMLSIVKDINEKVKLRGQKQKEKSSESTKLYNQINANKKLIEAKEREYNLSLDDNLLTEIKALKAENQDLLLQRESIGSTGILNYEFRYPCDSAQVISELESKLQELNFPELKENIIKSQEKYFEAMGIYNEAIKSLLQEKLSIRELESSIDVDCLKDIQNWCARNYQNLYVAYDIKISGDVSKARFTEVDLFNSIHETVSNFGGITGGRFESLHKQ